MDHSDQEKLAIVEPTFQPMEPRRRGRPKGSIGTKAKVARAIVEELNADPLRFLLRVMKNKRNPMPTRIQAAAHCLSFCHPKLSTQHVQLNAKVDSRHEILASIQDTPELAAQAERLVFMLEGYDLDKLGFNKGPTIDVEPIAVLADPKPR